MKKIVLILLLCCCAVVLASCGQAPTVAEVGKPAPDFTLVDRKGKTWTLSELKGQVVFVNFWATWCPPCREEMPSMQRLHTMLPQDKFKMLAILNSDDPALADSFAAKLGITMPILDDQANTVGPKYGLTGVPETFIVDKQGVLREKFIGPARWDSPGYIQMLTKYINQ
ncbi:MAG: TlpA family protein disulfide reductase [Proteobacteria bacterium]|nr:TlpA family protein disulfide reductase [Pseudomonadota bacterium]MBU1058598.1 TlpA family protein disulfide reductase [Pseudomonadota bacterium]